MAAIRGIWGFAGSRVGGLVAHFVLSHKIPTAVKEYSVNRRHVGASKFSLPPSVSHTLRNTTYQSADKLPCSENLFLPHGSALTPQESLRTLASIAAENKKLPPGTGKVVYLSNLAVSHMERRWVPGTSRNSSGEGAAKAAANAATATAGAIAVAVAAAAAGAAQAEACAGKAKEASALGETADLYETAKAFLVENPEFSYIWISSVCLPPQLRAERWRGALPGVFGSNMFEHLHPGALLTCDAVLVAPPERESLAWEHAKRVRYTDLEMFRCCVNRLFLSRVLLSEFRREYSHGRVGQK